LVKATSFCIQIVALDLFFLFLTYTCLNCAANRKIKEEGSEMGEEESKAETGMQ